MLKIKKFPSSHRLTHNSHIGTGTCLCAFQLWSMGMHGMAWHHAFKSYEPIQREMLIPSRRASDWLRSASWPFSWILTRSIKSQGLLCALHKPVESPQPGFAAGLNCPPIQRADEFKNPWCCGCCQDNKALKTLRGWGSELLFFFLNHLVCGDSKTQRTGSADKETTSILYKDTHLGKSFYVPCVDEAVCVTLQLQNHLRTFPDFTKEEDFWHQVLKVLHLWLKF